MTALATAQRPQRFATETFEAFTVNEAGKAYRQRAHDTDTLEAAVENLTEISTRGDTFFVRCTDTLTGKVTLRFYAVRQRSPQWMSVGGETRRVAKRYAEPLHCLQVEGLL